VKVDVDIPKLYALLRECKYKLQLYRDQHSGQYIGGVEFVELRRRIDESMEELTIRGRTGCDAARS
jgi:hypothetical protein